MAAFDPFAAPGAGKKSQPFDPFAPPADSAEKAAAAFDPFGVPKGAGTSPEAEAAALEEKVKAAGLGEHLPGPLGWAARVLSHPLSQNIIDIISRPEYAIAGAGEEIAKGRPAAAPVRAAIEAASGIGGIKGQKKGVAQVLEDVGVPTLGSLSDVLPGSIMPTAEVAHQRQAALDDYIRLHPFGAYLDPAIWLQEPAAAAFYQGGPADITTRGILSQPFAIAFNPLTYLGAPTGEVSVLTEQGMKTLSAAGAKAMSEGAAKILPAAAVKAETLVPGMLGPEGRAVMEKTAEKFATAEAQQAFTQAGGTVAEKVAAQGKFLKALDESPALQEMIGERKNELLRAGFERSGPEFRQFTQDAVDQARNNVVAAANSGNPEFFSKGGLSWMGMTLPGTPAVAATLSKGAHDVLAGLRSAPVIGGMVRAGDAVRDSLGPLLYRDFDTRLYPYWQAVKQADRDWQASYMSGFFREMEASPEAQALAKLKKPDFEAANRRIVDAVESGKVDALSPAERPLGEMLQRFSEKWALAESAAGSDYVPRLNYFPHFYDNTQNELDAIFDIAKAPRFWKGKSIQASLGPHAEERSFDTLKDALDYANFRKTQQSGLADLKPIYNIFEAVGRRANSSAAYIGRQNLLRVIEDKIGQTLPFDINERFDLAPVGLGRKLTAQEAKTLSDVTAAVQKGGTDIAWVKSLPKEAQAEFIRQRLAKAASEPELSNIANKYGDLLSLIPARDASPGLLDAEGNAMVPVLVDGYTYYVPGPVRDSIAMKPPEALSRGPFGKILRGYDRFLLGTKTALTVPYPSFSFRNAYNNVAQEFLQIGLRSLDPRSHLEAARILGGATGEHITPLGARWSYDEIRNAAREVRAIVPPREFFEVARQGVPEAGAGPLRRVGETVRSFTGFVENQARLHLFMDGLDRGMTPQAAATLVKDTFFDYENLSHFEKEYMRRLIPFYTWPRKNIEYQAKMLVKRPGLVAAEATPFRGRPEEDRVLPQWQAGSFRFRLGKDANTVHVLSGVDMPIKQLDMLWGGAPDRTVARWIGQTTPPLRAIYALASRREPFTGNELTASQVPTVGRFLDKFAPSWLKGLLGYSHTQDAAGRDHYTIDGPKYYVLFQSWAISRVLSTTDRQFRSIVSTPQGAKMALDVLTGLRAEDWDLDAKAKQRAYERLQYLHDLRARAGREKKSVGYEEIPQVGGVP